MRHSRLTLLPLLALACAEDPLAGQTTATLLSRATSLLSAGQASSALELFDAVLARDPSDYLTVYKKAATHMSVGQNRMAIDSFNKVLQLADYDKARLQLGKVYLKMGDFAAGKLAVDQYVKKNKDDEGVKIQQQLNDVEKRLTQGKKTRDAKNWEKCVEESTLGIQLSPQSLELRRLRSDCYLGMGSIDDAAADLTRSAQLDSSSAPIALRLSVLSALFLGHPSTHALAPIRQCLHSDPESKPCKKLFRLLKNMYKDIQKVQNFVEAGSYRSAIKILDPPNRPEEGLIEQVRVAIAEARNVDITLGEAILPPGTAPDTQSKVLTTLLAHACKAHVQLNQPRLGKKSCLETLLRDADNVDGLVGQGETLILEDSWEEAVRVLSQAFENGGRQDRDVLSRLQKAQKGLKVSKQKDYYKVIGCSRDADDRTLKKAYRRATLTAHPDKGGSEERMAALNEAYEVLSNPELRQRYDNGDDPNDHTQQGQHPFQQGGGQMYQQFFQGGGGGFPGGGGGGSFSFRWG